MKGPPTAGAAARQAPQKDRRLPLVQPSSENRSSPGPRSAGEPSRN